MSGPTWKKIEEARKNTSDQKIMPDPFLELCYLTFDKNPAGKKLLAHMIEVSIMGDSFHGLQSDRDVFMKLGKQELIKSIKKAIEVYKHQEEK